MPTAPTSAPLDKLERTIHARAKKPNAKSYTSQLLEGGVPKIGAKIVEEAAEVVEAAGEPGQAGPRTFHPRGGRLVLPPAGDAVPQKLQACTTSRPNSPAASASLV